MSHYYLFHDKNRCIACHSCEIQCESHKLLPSGPRICEVITLPSTQADDPHTERHMFMTCFHCENPWCVAVCPTGAMKKRRKDGIVYVDRALCIGCKTCIAACPWGSVQWDPSGSKVVKCDYCMDRIDQGLQPACVTVCTTHCLEFGLASQKTPDSHRKPVKVMAPLPLEPEPAPVRRCPVNALSTELEGRIQSGQLIDPKSRRRTEKILSLIQDIACGNAGSEHIPTMESFAQKLIAEGPDDISRNTGSLIAQAISESREVFVSHLETGTCATGECLKLAPAPCQMTCPAGIDIPTYVTLIARGQYEEAINVIRKDNPFPWICGLICTRPCELMCVRGRMDQPISIKYLKAFAAEIAMSGKRYKNPDKEPDKEQKVCIIGAGPAGMSAAYYLSLKGYGVRVIESQPTAGGMMLLGIPRYRLSCRVIDLEVNMLEELGVEFWFDTIFGKDVTLNSLRDEGFDAFFLAIGAHESFLLNIPGEKDYTQVLQAIELLRRVALGDWEIPGERVVVIGGGNVAIDAARTCLRLGCDSVTMAYRRTDAEMPADIEEVHQAVEEGVQISFLTIPVEVVGKDGHVTGLRCIRAEMIAQEGSNRRRPVPIEGSEFVMDADAVISAIGQKVDHDCLSSISDLKWTRRNTLFVSRINLKTTSPGIFAAGDAVSGPATVIEAIGAGKRAADAIDRHLSGIPQPKMPPVPVRRGRIDWLEMPAATKMELTRPSMPLLPIDKRLKTFQQVETGYSEEQVQAEASRCLRCDICIRCGRCVEICRDKMKVDALQMGYIHFDHPGPSDFRVTESRCILCGACAANCPTGAIKMEDRGDERVLSLCGAILNRQKLIRCESCGAVMGTSRYLEYILNRHQKVIQVPENRTLCYRCTRKAIAGYAAQRWLPLRSS